MFMLELTKNDSKFRIPSNEEFYIGREITEINDKSNSRKQILIFFDDTRGTLKAKKIGLKPSFIMRGTNKFEMEKDKEIQLCKNTPFSFKSN